MYPNANLEVQKYIKGERAKVGKVPDFLNLFLVVAFYSNPVARFVRNNMYETMLKLVFPFIIIPLRDEKHSTSNAKSVQCTSKGHTQGCANSERLNV